MLARFRIDAGGNAHSSRQQSAIRRSTVARHSATVGTETTGAASCSTTPTSTRGIGSPEHTASNANTVPCISHGQLRWRWEHHHGAGPAPPEDIAAALRSRGRGADHRKRRPVPANLLIGGPVMLQGSARGRRRRRDCGSHACVSVGAVAPGSQYVRWLPPPARVRRWARSPRWPTTPHAGLVGRTRAATLPLLRDDVVRSAPWNGDNWATLT